MKLPREKVPVKYHPGSCKRRKEAKMEEIGPGLAVTSMHQKIINIGTMKFTPSKAEQPLQGMELQQNEAQKRLKNTGNLFRKNVQLTTVCSFQT